MKKFKDKKFELWEFFKKFGKKYFPTEKYSARKYPTNSNRPSAKGNKYFQSGIRRPISKSIILHIGIFYYDFLDKNIF